MKVHYSRIALEQVEQYYEMYQDDYRFGYKMTDLRQRADNYRKIARVLSNIEHYLDHTYDDNGIKFIIIENVATIEYKVTKKKEILVKNINFNDCQNNSTLL